MPSSGIITPSSLNLAINPLLHKPGDMVRCINVENDQFGAKKKRPGYVTYLGTPDNSAVDSLWSWRQDNGTQFWTYRASGGTVYYSTQGTGAFTICGNGTMTSGTPIFNAVMENTMLICDGVAATRHTTNGTSFTNTTSAPIARGLVDYQNRIYAIGTASTMFWSNVGTPTDWTNDSSSINIPGPGRLHTAMKVSDRIVTGKNSGVMHRWDGYNLFDLSTNLGPSSPTSVADIEGVKLYLNRLGEFGFNGNKPEILSNAIEKVIYNDADEGIAGTSFNNSPGIAHRYEYFCSVGTVTDDLTDETVSNAITVYDFQADDWWIDTFSNRPTAFGTYLNSNDNVQMIFGDGSGQWSLAKNYQ